MKRGFKRLFKPALSAVLAASIILPSSAMAFDSAKKAEETYKRGDISLDNKVDILDVAIGRSQIVGNYDFSDLQYMVADMDDNGDFNILDIVLLRSIIVDGTDGGTINIGTGTTDTDTSDDTPTDTQTDTDTQPDNTDTETDTTTDTETDTTTDTETDITTDTDTETDSEPDTNLDTDVTNSTKDNFAEFESTVDYVDINGDKLYSQDSLVKEFSSFGNLYDDALYDNGSGSDVGICFCGWNLDNYINDPSLDYKMNYFTDGSEYGVKRMTFIPTYFLATYNEGIKVNGTNTLTPDQQADILAQALKMGVRINYRPHIDPQRFAPDGYGYNSVDINVPGSQWWRGEFTQVDPMSKDYIAMIDKGFEALEKTFQKVGNIKLAEPIRFDIGAELMTSVKNYTGNWIELAKYCIAKRDASPYLKDNVVFSYNFCHHIEYLIELDNHADYFERINGTGVTYLDRQDLLFVDDMSEENRLLLGEFIKTLDVFSISQYMPMDIFEPADIKSTNVATTPEDVRDALLTHEQNFLQKILMGKLGLKPDEIPPFFLGEYGMGIKGLTAPNVWDRTAWTDAELATLEAQRKHAEIAIKGLMLYMQDERTVAKSLSLWISGAPYDVINFYPGMNIGDSGHGYPGQAAYNYNAAAALKDYWADGKLDNK